MFATKFKTIVIAIFKLAGVNGYEKRTEKYVNRKTFDHTQPNRTLYVLQILQIVFIF